MKTEAQKRAQNKYNKKCHRVSIQFFPTENDLWEYITQHSYPVATHIKACIRACMINEKNFGKSIDKE